MSVVLNSMSDILRKDVGHIIMSDINFSSENPLRIGKGSQRGTVHSGT